MPRELPDAGDAVSSLAESRAALIADDALPLADRRSRALPLADRPALVAGTQITVGGEPCVVIGPARLRDWIVVGWREVDAATSTRRRAYGTIHRAAINT